MAKKKSKSYTVINGFNTSDETRYEVGDTFDPKDHPRDLDALLEMNCLEEDGNS